MRGAFERMSLQIDSRYITGIYALSQWFKVVPDTFGIDAYELTAWDGRAEQVENVPMIGYTDYIMGELYRSVQPEYESGRWPHTGGGWANPSGSAGVCFTDAETGERVSFSLMEVKAFREKRP